VANPDYRVGVWVRSAGNAADAQEAEASVPFAIIEEVAPATPIHSVAIAANMTAPQLPGTTVTFSASPTGGAAPYQYKWWIYEDGWKPMGSWTTSRTFAWTPAAANAGGRITVWVRSAGNLNDQAEGTAAMDFVIAAPPAAPAPVAPVAPVAPAPSARVSSVTIGANKVAPQPAGTTTTFTALPAGGTAPYQYKWWVYNGDAWVPMTNWTTSQTFAWTSATANAGGRVTVWVRSAGSTIDEAESAAAMDFVISGGTAPAPAARVTGATIAANLVAPQPPGTTITFTATPTGGAAPHEYKWWIYNGDAWVPITGWTTSSTFKWTPTATNLGGRVTVWVRSAGATADEAQATAAMDFVIK
jgi:N-acetylmuramoyl-L-alanine amidase